MKITFFFILFFSFSKFSNANDTCDDFKPLGEDIALFDWLVGELPYGTSDFNEKTWKVSHLEIPIQKIPIAVINYLSSKSLLNIENKDVEYFMNSTLIKMPNERQNAYLVRGVIYSNSGKIDVYFDSENNNLFVVHGSIHRDNASKKEKFMFQPIIVYLDNEPKVVNINLAEGSAAAFKSLCEGFLGSK